MTWWCSAQGLPWDWTWRPYPGVWILLAALITWRVVTVRRETGHARILLYLLGVLVLWLAADWPLGALGAGYLLSAHTAQYLLFTLVAPPLLIAGTPPSALRRMIRPSWAARIARFLNRPLVAFAVFNTVLLASHLPTVVDGLMTSQIGSFAIDMAWLVAGIVFWWQVFAPLPELGALPYPGRIAFLIMNIFIPTVPAAFLTFADYPIYALYELAPPIGNISARDDQQVAGLMMKIVGALIIFGTASALYFRWTRREGANEEPEIVLPEFQA